MEIIGDKSRLVGCDIKLNFIVGYDYWSNGHVGETFKILSFDDYYSGSDPNSSDCYVENYRIDHRAYKFILNSTFLEKFKKEKIVVNCKSEEEAREFCDWFEEINGFNYRKSTDHLLQYFTGEVKYFYDSGGGYPCLNTYNETDQCKDYTIIKFKDCIIDEEEEMKEKTYKILVPISLKSIMEAKPCNSYGEVGKFTNELIEKGHDINHEISTWEEFNEYEVLKEYKNWFFGENRTKTVFIEEEKSIPELKVGQLWKGDEYTFRVVGFHDNLYWYHEESYTIISKICGWGNFYKDYELVEE